MNEKNNSGPIVDDVSDTSSGIIDLGSKILIDAHTHISNLQSIPNKIQGIRTTETLVVSGNKTIPKTDVFFSALKDSGGSGYLAFAGLKIIQIGKKMVDTYQKSIACIPSINTRQVFSICIVLPLDMEFAHYDGYGMKEDEKVPTLHPVVKYAGQIKEIIKACKKSPWQLLPLFHYDPRRYREKEGQDENEIVEISKKNETQAWNAPFRFIAAADSIQHKEKGMFLGFKMYTPQGYKPLDAKLIHMGEFYAKCVVDQIPIMAHCNPGGNITFDWEKYFENNKNDKVKEEYETKLKYNHFDLEQKEDRKLIKARRFQYFLNEFMHPRVWMDVLEMEGNCNLKLCLAHFGGVEDWTGDKEHPYVSVKRVPWIEKVKSIQNSNAQDATENAKKYLKTVRAMKLEMVLEISQINFTHMIVEMIQSAEYPNLYTDLAFLPVFDEKIKEAFKKTLLKYPGLIERILFGTDWLVLLRDYMNYKFIQQYVPETKKYLDTISREISEEAPGIKEKYGIGKMDGGTGEIDLWRQFTDINPKEFFGLNKIQKVRNIAAALLEENDGKSQEIKNIFRMLTGKEYCDA
jgi:hypothetical protein